MDHPTPRRRSRNIARNLGCWLGAVLAVALLTATNGAAQSAEVALLRGRVTTNDGAAPLAGVTVELVEAERRVFTDNLGVFRFAGVAPGDYTLRFSLIGHDVHRQEVRVTGGGVLERTVDLGADPVVLEPLLALLDRTRMIGRGTAATDLPGSAHVLGPQTLDERKVLFGDIHQVLREVPGVHMQEEDGYGLRPNIGMRGTGSDRSGKITVMEDGVLAAPAPYSAPAAYYFPLVGRMEAVEVRKGSSQIRYGPFTVGGALNLVSSSIPSALSILVDGAGGEQSTRKLRVRAGDSTDRFGWMLETYQLGTDGFKVLDGGGQTGFDLSDYVGKVRFNTALGGNTYQEVELKVGFYDQTSDETYLGLTQDDFELTPFRRYAASQEDVMNAEQRQIALRHFARVGAFDFTTTAYRNTFDRNWYKLQSVGGASIAAVLDDPAANADRLTVIQGGTSAPNALRVRANNRGYEARGVQTVLGWRTSAALGHDVEIGARFHQDEEDRFQHEDGYSMTGGALSLTSRGAPGSQENRFNNASAWSFYVQDRFEVGSLVVSPGLRYESISFERHDFARTDPDRSGEETVRENGVDVWIPGIGASLAIAPGATLVAGIHRGFAPPGPGANEDTRPEYSVNYELGARLSRDRIRLEALGYFSGYTNILGAETASSGGDGSGNLYNGGSVDAWGVEMSTDADLLTSGREWRVPVHAAYTYTNATFKTAFRSDYEPWGTVNVGDELPYIPAHQLFVRGGVERGPLSGQLTAAAVSASRTAAGSGPIPTAESTDSYLILGASVDYAVGRSTTVYGGIENLMDERYVVARQPAGLRPGLPRTVQIGLRVTR